MLTTNNQNKISSRDLRANDAVQLDMKRGFARYGYLYERKPRQYDAQPGVNTRRIVANEVVAQSYLAVVLKKPSDARRRKYKVWGELYDQIFSGTMIEPYVITTQIYSAATTWPRTSGYTDDQNDLRRKLANNGAFHLARIASYLWGGSDEWRTGVAGLEQRLSELECNPHLLDLHLQRGLELLESVINSNHAYISDLDNALKSTTLDLDLDQVLHTSRSRS